MCLVGGTDRHGIFREDSNPRVCVRCLSTCVEDFRKKEGRTA